MADAGQAPGTIIIPAGEKLLFTSELFDVVVRFKDKKTGVLGNTRYLLLVEILDQDPSVEKRALIEVPEDVWRDIGQGEKAKARLYLQDDQKTWSTKMPLQLPERGQ